MELLPNDPNYIQTFKNPSSNYQNQNINGQTKKIQNYIFNMNQILGKGNFSKVYKAINQLTNQIVAIKVVQLSSIKTQALLTLLYSQIDILKMIKHPNILNCIEVFSSANNCYIITQLCNQGDFQSKIKLRGCFQERQCKKLIYQVYQGLKYLGEQHIVHRDLKIANIFLKNGTAKIADFGFAKKTTQQFKDINIGSPIYMSPEGLIDNIYGPKTDVWAFGVFIYQILHGDTPLGFCKTQAQLKFHIINPISNERIKQNISNQLKDLIRRCLQIDYRKRISIKDIQMHPYMQKLIRQFQQKQSVILSNQRQNYILNAQSNQLQKNNKITIDQNSFNNNYYRPQSNKKIQLQKINTTTLSPSKANRANYLQIPTSLQNRKFSPISPKIIQNYQSNSHSQIRKGNLSFKIQNNDPRKNVSIQKDRQIHSRNFSQNPSNISSYQTNQPSIKKQYLTNLDNNFQNEKILLKSNQKINVNIGISNEGNTKILNCLITFQECVQLLHYCRLIYKTVSLLKRIGRQHNGQKLIQLYSFWLLDILQQIDNKIHNYVKFEGQKALMKQKKLKQVISQYYTKYSKQLSKNNTNQPNIQIIQKATIKYLFYLDGQINSSNIQKNEFSHIAHYLFCIYETGLMIHKCMQINQFSYLVKNSNIQNFLSTKNFDALSYALIQSKLKKISQ